MAGRRDQARPGQAAAPCLPSYPIHGLSELGHFPPSSHIRLAAFPISRYNETTDRPHSEICPESDADVREVDRGHLLHCDMKNCVISLIVSSSYLPIRVRRAGGSPFHSVHNTLHASTAHANASVYPPLDEKMLRCVKVVCDSKW